MTNLILLLSFHFSGFVTDKRILVNISSIVVNIIIFASHFKMSPMDKEIMNVSDCALMLGKSKDTIRKYISDVSIPFYKKNGSIYFLRSEILNWIKDGKR